MRHRDWGVVAPSWAGIHSVTTTVCGVDVHHLVRDPDPTAPTSAPTHVLVSAMTGSATNWLDLVPVLARSGRVIVPDLPGTLTGHTASPTRRGPRAETNARFVRAFVRTLALQRVILHGWSMGGLVSVRTADLAPDRIAGLVLTAPALPWRRTSLAEAVGWQTIGRLAVLLGTPVARAVLRWSARPVLCAKLAALRDLDAPFGGGLDLAGGDPRRLSAELIGVWADDLTAVRAHPERLAGSATALASALWAMFIDQRPTLALLDRLDVPVLLLWGSDDPLADDATLRGHARRPRWMPRVIEGAGHVLPVEVPEAYGDAVADWLGRAGHDLSA